MERWSTMVARRSATVRRPSVRVQLSNAEFNLTAPQVQSLIEAAARPRDRVLIRLLAETGLRRHEAAQLTISDVDVAQRLVIVRNGKGNKLRVVPITARLAGEICHLTSMLQVGPVFVSRQRHRLSLRQINRIVSETGRRAGIHHPNPRYGDITCHLLRHTFARLWKAHNGSIESLSKVLGHHSVKLTWDVYGKQSLADVSRNYDITLKKILRSNKKHEGGTGNDR